MGRTCFNFFSTLKIEKHECQPSLLSVGLECVDPQDLRQIVLTAEFFPLLESQSYEHRIEQVCGSAMSIQENMLRKVLGVERAELGVRRVCFGQVRARTCQVHTRPSNSVSFFEVV